MKTPSHTAESLRLVFDWASRQDRRRRLLLWLLVALVLHVGAIVLLQHTPPMVPIRPVSEAVLFVVSDVDDDGMAAFVSASNPALFAPGRVREGLLDAPPLPVYRPSFDKMDFKPLPLPPPATRVLPSLDARLFDALSTSDNTAALPVAEMQQQTQIRISPDLDSRAKGHSFKNIMAMKSAGDTQPSVFLVAVDADGRVRHAINRSSAMNEDLDEVVLMDIMRLPFFPLNEVNAPPLAWGTITIYWGEPSEDEK